MKSSTALEMVLKKDRYILLSGNELRYDQKLVEDGEPLNLDPFISTTKTETPKGLTITIHPRALAFAVDSISRFQFLSGAIVSDCTCTGFCI